MSENYVAAFCPHCGNLVNELDTQDSPDQDEAYLGTTYGSRYTCGWCQLRTNDWNHVKQCRKTWRTREALIKSQQESEHIATMTTARGRLNRLIYELEESSGDG